MTKCTNPNHDAYPYYGVAPHTHDLTHGVIGSTRIKPKDTWPANFQELTGPDDEGCGIYVCPTCLGKSEQA